MNKPTMTNSGEGIPITVPIQVIRDIDSKMNVLLYIHEKGEGAATVQLMLGIQDYIKLVLSKEEHKNA